jgi:transglutaminase-like putative cysteine protease
MLRVIYSGAVLSLLLPVSQATAGPAPKYAVADLPAALRENAHAVIRQQQEQLLVKSAARTVETTHRAVTILDEAGARWASELVYYSSLNSISYFRGAVYDAGGRLLRQLRSQDIQDISLSDGFSLASDARGRVADLSQPTYPYTVEFDYEVVSDNPLFYSTWRPQPVEQLAVEQASFRVLMPTGLALRFQEQHLPAGTAQAKRAQGSQEVYEWQVSNLVAREEEADAPPLAELTPAVYTAPSEFEVQGHAGRLNSWADLSRWTYELNAGRDELPPALKAGVAALVQGETDERARIRKVYRFLQANTRYISVQLGLGGWQTFPASSVAANGYGDCKALTNYCQALLGAAGITAHAALVRAGSDEQDIRTSFPSSQFNHVVLCVPLRQSARPDTVWLECTSQTNPFGYMGGFTGNRHALLLLPEGGKLIPTPRYGAAENRRERLAHVYLDTEGNATATLRTLRTGLEYDAVSGLPGLELMEQKKRIGSRLSLPNFTLTKVAYQHTSPTAPLPGLTETLALTLPALAPPSGKRVFLMPNLLSRLAPPQATVGERQSDLLLDHAFTQQDTVLLHLPASLRPEQLPAPVQLSTAFGTYSSQLTTLPDGSLRYVRRLVMPRTRFARTEYPAYLEFRRKISAADKAQLVLLKTEA